jgi:hypothetical protein
MDGAVVKYVIYMCVALFVCAYLLPPALFAIANATVTKWNPAVSTIFQVLLPILAIIGVALLFMPPDVKSKIGL